jgi:hypothetical protein
VHYHEKLVEPAAAREKVARALDSYHLVNAETCDEHQITDNYDDINCTE